jgi:hypothetical protein
MPKNGRTILTVALASMALVAVAGPVAAHDGKGDNERGDVGRHVFRDSVEKPGARCIYRAPEVAPEGEVSEVAKGLVRVSARPPKIAAFDRTLRVDRQPVAWRFILQEKLPEGEWTKVKRSRTQVRRGHEHRAAKFSRMGVRYEGVPDAEYRVKTKAYWLSKRNPLRRTGVASHLVQYYNVAGVVNKGFCPGSIPASDAS